MSVLIKKSCHLLTIVQFFTNNNKLPSLQYVSTCSMHLFNLTKR